MRKLSHRCRVLFSGMVLILALHHVGSSELCAQTGAETLLAPVVREGKTGFIEPDGDVRIPFHFEKASHFSGSAAPAMSEGKWGLIDGNGNWILEPSLDHIVTYASGLFLVNQGGQMVIGKITGGRWGLVDDQGTFRIPLRSDPVQYPVGGIAVTRRDNKWGWIVIEDGGEVPPQFDFVGSASEGLVAVNAGGTVTASGFVSGGKWGYRNVHGSEMLPCSYEAAYPFQNGRAIVKREGRWGVIDTTGKFLIQPRYDELAEASEGCYTASLGSRWGILDAHGAFLIPAVFIGIAEAEWNEIRVASQGTKWGAINRKGKWKIKPRFDALKQFDEGILLAAMNENYGLINVKGKWILPPDYSAIYFDAATKRYLLYQGAKTGLASDKGEVLITPRQGGLKICAPGIIAFSESGLWGLMNERGEVIVKPSYSEIGNFQSAVTSE